MIREEMRVILVAISKPRPGQEVLLVGYGEKKKHFIFELGSYEEETACKRYVNREGYTLHFEPMGWVPLPWIEDEFDNETNPS